MNKSALKECLLGNPGKGQRLNKEKGLPARGMGRETGDGRRREALRAILKEMKK